MENPTNSPLSPRELYEIERKKTDELLNSPQQQQAIDPVALAKLQEMAKVERERNQHREMANIGSAFAEQVGGLQKGNRLALDDDAKTKLQDLLTKNTTSSGLSLKDKLGVQSNREKTAGYDALGQNKQDRIDDRHDDNLDQRERKFKWKKGEEGEKKLTNELNNFRKDDVVKVADQQINAARVAADMLANPNPIMSEAVKTQLARAVGEKGALSEGDIARLGSSKQITEKLEQIWETYAVSGSLSDDNRRYLQEIADVLGNTGKKNKELRAREFAGQRGFGSFDQEQLYSTYMATPYSGDKKEPKKEKSEKAKPVKKQEAQPKVKIKLNDGRVGMMPAENAKKLVESGKAVIIEE